MKIIIKNRDQKPVFTFDVETGQATHDGEVISPNEAAAEFLRGLETAVKYASQYANGASIQDFLIEAGKGENNGNFTVSTGAAGEKGEEGGSVNIHNPTPSQPCTECTDGTQTLLSSVGPCTTCDGTQQVPDTT